MCSAEMQDAIMLPSPNVEPERYKGRPLLMVLENYILDCIGELPPASQQGLLKIVQHVFGGGEDWKATVRAELHLGETMDQSLIDLWKRNQEIARQQNVDLHPVQFAKMIADENFVNLIDSKKE